MHRLIGTAAVVSLLALVACPHSRRVEFVGGCEELPLIGPPSHMDVVRSALLDSALLGGRARLIAIVTWSSDSLANKSRPMGALVRVSASEADIHVDKLVDSSRAVHFLLPAEWPYRLTVQLVGSQVLDTTFTLREGFADTARVFLQAGGVRLCA